MKEIPTDETPKLSGEDTWKAFVFEKTVMKAYIFNIVLGTWGDVCVPVGPGGILLTCCFLEAGAVEAGPASRPHH